MVAISYLDTSAAVKLILKEDYSAELYHYLSKARDVKLASSWLLHTELHCAVGRNPNEFDIDLVNSVLDTVDLVDLTRGDLLQAGFNKPLRTHDAIHLAVALRIGAIEFITYDKELITYVKLAGLSVLSPGYS
ncbi:MAG: type II toxin-antitoxin system VapC family toxin [Acidimicrobiales bacterium]|nr:type II toxin-antitoxin system VapC family toxin [Acidimicrobiales bacterium]